MRFAVRSLTVVALACLIAANARADDKEVTLKGKLMCAKCELKEGKKCATVIKIKEDGKDVVYYLLDNGNKEDYHEEVCGGGQKEGTVVGTVTEKGGKKWIKPSKVQYGE